MLTQNEAREIFNYDADTGNLTWKENRGPKARKGGIVGCIHHSGYRVTLISKKNYSIHRLIWLWFYGEIPEQIDHINRNKEDNRIENLRACLLSENAKNKGIFVSNVSGYKGVSWCKRNNKYQVTCKVNGKKQWLGYFIDPIKASLAYKKFASENHGPFFPKEALK